MHKISFYRVIKQYCPILNATFLIDSEMRKIDFWLTHKVEFERGCANL